MASRVLQGSKKGLPKGVKRLVGTDMQSYLKMHPTVLYRYKPNSPGFKLLLVLASLAGGLGTAIWVMAGWATIWHIGAISTLLGVALALIVLVGYWTYFTRIAWLASSDRDLLFGRGSKVVAIEWDALNLDSLWFSGPGDDDVHGTLDVRLGEFHHRVRLYNGFACLENLEGFISTLLSSVKKED